MSTAQSTLPLETDIQWIIARAGVTNHFGYLVDGNDLVFRYRAEDFDAVQAAIDDYPVGYAEEVSKPYMLQQATDCRYEKMQSFFFAPMGKTLPCDDVSIARVTAAVVRMGLPGAPAACRWKGGPNAEDWVTLDLATLELLGSAMFDHVQACFNREEILHGQIRAAADIHALALIDVESGWPG